MKRTLLDSLKIVQHGETNQLDEFVHDENWFVRLQVAQHGSDEQRQQLIDDPMISVRATVAITGTETQQETLLQDPDPFVRQSALRNQYATKQQLINALDDVSSDVSEFAKEQLDVLGITIYNVTKKGAL